jgi:hypothetical protein
MVVAACVSDSGRFHHCGQLAAQDSTLMRTPGHDRLLKASIYRHTFYRHRPTATALHVQTSGDFPPTVRVPQSNDFFVQSQQYESLHHESQPSRTKLKDRLLCPASHKPRAKDRVQ